MASEKRKSKRPKAIQAKSRVTTEATKAKLPRPTRKKPANARLRPDTPTSDKVQCPRCEKWLRPGPHDIHTCYDAKALREEMATPSPIAGQPLDGIGSQPAPEVRAIPCGEDWTEGPTLEFKGLSILDADAEAADRAIICVTFLDGRTVQDERCPDAQHVPPPDTSAYPWPLKWAWKLDGWLAKLARWFA